MDLARDILMARELANEIEAEVDKLDTEILTEEETDQLLIAWATLEETYRVLAGAKADLAERLAHALPDKKHTVVGVGTFEAHTKTSRTQWDPDLWRVVLDSVKVDRETGEIIPETESQKLLQVWNLGAPRVTALRTRGIDPDEWAHVEYGKQTLRLVTS